MSEQVHGCSAGETLAHVEPRLLLCGHSLNARLLWQYSSDPEGLALLCFASGELIRTVLKAGLAPCRTRLCNSIIYPLMG